MSERRIPIACITPDMRGKEVVIIDGSNEIRGTLYLIHAGTERAFGRTVLKRIELKVGNWHGAVSPHATCILLGGES